MTSQNLLPLPVPAIIMIQNSETEGANYLGYFRSVLPRLNPNLHVVHYKMFNAEHLGLLPTCLKVSSTWNAENYADGGGGAGGGEGCGITSDGNAAYPFYCKPSDDAEHLPPTVVQPCASADPSAAKKPFVVVGALSFGGPMGAYEHEKYPFILKVVEFLKSVVSENVPYLGICLGAQLLARAFGGKCFQHTTAEFAFVPEETEEGACFSTPESAAIAKANGVFDWFGGRAVLPTFQAHRDTFTIPGLDEDITEEGQQYKGLLVRVAKGKYCANQAIQVRGKHILGVQWHPDVDLPKAQHWLGMVGQFMKATDDTPSPPGVYTFGENRAFIADSAEGADGDDHTKEPSMLKQTQQLADSIFNEWLVGVSICEAERGALVPMASSKLLTAAAL